MLLQIKVEISHFFKTSGKLGRHSHHCVCVIPEAQSRKLLGWRGLHETLRSKGPTLCIFPHFFSQHRLESP